LKLEQPLWTGGRVEASIQAAEREVDVSRARTTEAVDTIQLQVIDAYAEFWRSQAKLAASYDNVAALDELLAVITRRVAQEVSPRTEQVLAEARLQQALSEREQFRGAVDVAKSLLLQATNISVDKVLPLICEIPNDLDRKKFVAEVLQGSSRLIGLQGEYEVARANVDVAEAERWPKLVAGVQSNATDGFFSSRDTRAYLGFQYQLVDGLSANARLVAAQNAVQTVRYQEEVFRQQLTQQVTSFLDDYRMNVAQIPSLSALYRANKDLIDSYRRQYIVGKKSWLDVINAQREVSTAQNSLIDSEVNSCAHALRLQVLSGNEFVKESRVR